MGNHVNMVAIRYLNDRRWGESPERNVDVLVGLTEDQRAKLRFLAERFGDGGETVAWRLLDSAMEDALRVLGSHDYGSDELKALSADDQIRVVDGRVSVYRDEIRSILEEGRGGVAGDDGVESGGGMAEDVVTYYSGDMVTLKIQLEHRANFVNMEAVLRGTHENGSVLASLYAERPRLADVERDGTKRSEAVFQAEAARSTFVPGLEYELEQIKAQTVEGKTVVLGIDDLRELNEELRFRYAAEPASNSATVTDGRLE